MYQVREIFSQLATSEAEVGRLMETQATVEMELHSKTSYLQAELSQATAQKVSTSVLMMIKIVLTEVAFTY